VTLLERDYQRQLIIRLRLEFPGCVILKNDSAYMQGVPDLTILYGIAWAMLEVKAYENAPAQPNQEFYVRQLNEMSFAAFIYPSNEEDVIRELHQAFESSRATRFAKSK
jgi:hypothetical protein